MSPIFTQYLDQPHLVKETKEGMIFCQNSSNPEDSVAMFSSSLKYLKGGKVQDFQKAYHWLQMADQAGHRSAASLLKLLKTHNFNNKHDHGTNAHV